MFCPRCLIENPDSASVCSSCGQPLARQTEKTKQQPSEQHRRKIRKQAVPIGIAGIPACLIAAVSALAALAFFGLSGWAVLTRNSPDYSAALLRGRAFSYDPKTGFTRCLTFAVITVAAAAVALLCEKGAKRRLKKNRAKYTGEKTYRKVAAFAIGTLTAGGIELLFSALYLLK
ncbi:MAG: hypothetical protein MJ085_00420 [Clostridia bacterium]|nr:hypothetical protein [Clostridia bacterium]